jgi:hypothetical protein
LSPSPLKSAKTERSCGKSARTEEPPVRHIVRNGRLEKRKRLLFLKKSSVTSLGSIVFRRLNTLYTPKLQIEVLNERFQLLVVLG